jgi:hypothetical protein
MPRRITIKVHLAGKSPLISQLKHKVPYESQEEVPRLIPSTLQKLSLSQVVIEPAMKSLPIVFCTNGAMKFLVGAKGRRMSNQFTVSTVWHIYCLGFIDMHAKT